MHGTNDEVGKCIICNSGLRLFLNLNQSIDVLTLNYFCIIPVPFRHGKGLYDTLPEEIRYPPFWAEKMGHNNIGKIHNVKLYNDILLTNMLETNP
jgi:hypothetical protein